MTCIPRYRRLLAVAVALFFIAGCANTTRVIATNDIESGPWSGRLALTLQTSPPESFSANFELTGAATAGTLTLSTALGNTVARVEWTPAGAVLQTTSAPQTFDSMGSLTRHLLGTELPVTSLFAWLQGTDEPAAGWTADLQHITRGRLTARRFAPEPPVELRIILDH